MPTEAITKIAEAYHAGKEVAGFVKVITSEEAAANDYNLSPGRFVVAESSEVCREIEAILADLNESDTKAARISSEMGKALAQLSRSKEVP